MEATTFVSFSDLKRMTRAELLDAGAKIDTCVRNTRFNSQITDNSNKNSIEIGVDYLTLIVKAATDKGFRDIIEFVEGTFDETIEYDSQRAQWMCHQQYTGSSTNSVHGTRVWTKAPRDGEMGEMRIVLGGKVLSKASSADVLDFSQIMLHMYQARCTRFDAAIDDYAKILSLDEVRKAQLDGNFAHVSSTSYYESGERGKRERGITIGMGARQSEAYQRIYDKNVESSGEIDAIRMETEFKGDKAQYLFEQFCEYDLEKVSEAYRYIAGAAIGTVRYCDRSSEDKNLDRLVDLPWYAKFCQRVGNGFRVKLRKKVATLSDKIGWVKKAVVPSLAEIKAYMGDVEFWQWLEDDIAEASAILSPIQIARVKQQREYDQQQQQDRQQLREVETTERLRSLGVVTKTKKKASAKRLLLELKARE